MDRITGEGAPPDILTVDFCGELRELTEVDSLTFGRRADLAIDDNPYLHRVVGRFVHRQGLWWLQNHGSRTTLELRDSETAARGVLLSGQQIALVYSAFSISFAAGPTSYELLARRSGMEIDAEDVSDPGGTATIDFGVVALSAEQHLLLVALCESRLLTGSVDIPTNAQLATRLGWTITKYNRKLDHLCAKLSREGVRGLRGGPDGLATDRRQALVEHALTVELVTEDDLGLLATRAR